MTGVVPLLQLQGVCHAYEGGVPALDDCHLAIAPGSRNALLGPNGAGKTTLLLHAIGLLRPHRGSIAFAGRPLTYDRAGLRELRQQVGLVFQNPERQLFSASVHEDVSFGPLNLGLPDDEVRRRVRESLAAVGLAGWEDRSLQQLSFGQKKRVCIAGVLAMRPRLLLLDEPLAGLDRPMREELLRLLDELAAAGITILLTTHDLDFAYAWADRIHLLAAGRSVAAFAAAELPAHAAALATAGQQMPAVVALHQQLAAQGLLPATPAPRSLAALSQALAGTAVAPVTPSVHLAEESC